MPMVGLGHEFVPEAVKMSEEIIPQTRTGLSELQKQLSHLQALGQIAWTVTKDE